MQRFEHGGNIYQGVAVTLDFSANLNPLGMPPSVKKAISENPERFEIYPDPDCRELRAALASYHGIVPEDILAGNGADDLIYRMAFAKKPRKVLLTGPSFSEYEKSAVFSGAEVVFHSLSPDNDFLVTQAFVDEITDDIDLVYLCTPNNPTGVTVPEKIIRATAEACMAHDAIFVLDECFICFTDKESSIPLLEQYPCMAILEAFTKRYAMAGLRLGYIISKNHGLLQELKGCGPCWNVSGPAQAAGLAALQSNDYLAEGLALIRTEAEYLKQELVQLGLRIFPSEANYIFFYSKQPLYDLLREKGVLIRSCDNYPGLCQGYYRICVSTHEKNRAFLSLLKEVLHG